MISVCANITLKLNSSFWIVDLKSYYFSRLSQIESFKMIVRSLKSAEIIIQKSDINPFTDLLRVITQVHFFSEFHF